MADKRVITRQEPITVEVPAVKHEFVAKPLFWRDRLDFGNAIVTEYGKTLSQPAPHIESDDAGGSRLAYDFIDRDYPALMRAAYPDDKPLANGMTDKLDVWEMVDLLKVAMEVNGLERLVYMVDPRLKDPLTMALESGMGLGDGQRTPSSTDVSSPASTPTPSSVETAPLD